jgi:hypothetical protein
MLKPHATINLPLHGGYAPPYLIKRMIKLSHAISKVIVDQYGQHEFLRRLSDPLWFQALGCVLGFDWHSSGVTTVVTGVLKQSLTHDTHALSIAGGKGKRSFQARNEIQRYAEKYFNLSTAKIDQLLYASKMASKVDNAAVQDGYSLYHHVILFDKDGNWTVVQQGMNPHNKMARRYHWQSDYLKKFVCEPHTGIISGCKNPNTLDMTSIDSIENQNISLDLARDSINHLKSSVYKIVNSRPNVKSGGGTFTLDGWINETSHENKPTAFTLSPTNFDSTESFEMPRRLNWKLFKKIYDIQPRNYEEMLSIPGFGPTAVRALSLIGELIFGTRASWQDPVKFNFAHGGKDGVPYPVARNTYDKSISYLHSAIEGADIERELRVEALKKLAKYSAKLFSNQDN